MKYSRQRELVREAIAQSDQHPTADAVYQQVRKKEPTISLATIYRNLNQLADHRMIRRIVVPGDSDHFDHRMAEHEHMVCTQCGCVVDVTLQHALLEQFQAIESTAQVMAYELILYGLCPRCIEKTNNHAKDKAR